MTVIPEDIKSEFVAAGWSPQRTRRHILATAPSNSHALAVLEEFGGLNVGSCGPGVELARSNVQFLERFVPAKSQAVESWQKHLGHLTAVADAHNQHIMVFVAEDERYYFFTDPDQKLYLGGLNFGEAMRRLLLGLQYGRALEPNSNVAVTDEPS